MLVFSVNHSRAISGSNVVHSQHFKETVSNGKKGTGSLAANSINMELDHPEDKLSSLGPNPQMDTEKPLKLPSSDGMHIDPLTELCDYLNLSFRRYKITHRNVE